MTKAKALIKSAVIKRPIKTEEAHKVWESNTPFGEGMYKDVPDALQGLYDAVRYALELIKEEGKTNDERIDVSRGLLAEMMALTWSVKTGPLNSLEFLYSADQAWQAWVELAEEWHDKYEDENLPHWIWCRIAYMHNIKGPFNRGKQSKASKEDKLYHAHVRESFIRLKWGIPDKYLNPKKEDWEHENEGNKTIRDCYI